MNAALDSTAQQNWAKQAVAKQRDFFESGVTRSHEFRIAQLKQFKIALIRYQDEIAAALKADIGRPPFEAFIELNTLMDDLNHTIGHLHKWMKPVKAKTSKWAQPGTSRIEYTPRGVSLIIGPYNYPFLLCMQPMLGSIAAGNTVIIKPSSLTPATGKIIERIAKEYFSPDIVQVHLGSTDITDALLEERFDHIFFTGSARVGRIVMAKAARHLTPVTLELGGKSPTIVHSDAKLEIAVRRILSGKMLNAGQTCIAPDHIFVHAPIQKAFEQKMVEMLRQFYGDNPQKSADFGRMINDRHFDRVKGLIDPAKVLAGGQTDKQDRYIAPTLLHNVSLDDSIMQEEIFGPVLPIISYQNLSEVYQHVKRLPSHPLALYLFTESKSVEDEVLANIQFGGGCINNTVVHVASASLPFGGVGESGMGAYHAQFSFQAFSHQRSIVKSAALFDIPLRFPPYKNNVKILKALFR
ncbi:Aldehyde dehydrogenase [gamma proteobacterium HdN1]|nr:Aldehyde dehydrogenase [gamma proteobacterium HdN1]